MGEEDPLLKLPGGESSQLESGQIINHHRRDECGGACCFHGTTIYESCRMPRSWRNDKRIIEHLCPCGIGHPCAAALDYMSKERGDEQGVHGCCGISGHCTLWIEVEEEPAPDTEASREAEDTETSQEAAERMINWMNTVNDALKGFATWAETHRDTHHGLDKLFDRREARLHERMDKLRSEIVLAGSVGAILTIVACLCLIAIFK